MTIHACGQVDHVLDTLYPFNSVKQEVTLPAVMSSVTDAVTNAMARSGEELTNAVVTVNTLNSENRVEKVFCRVDKTTEGTFDVETITYGGIGDKASDIYWGTAFSDEPMYNEDEQDAKILSGSLGDLNVLLQLEEK